MNIYNVDGSLILYACMFLYIVDGSVFTKVKTEYPYYTVSSYL